jgi:protein quaking
MHLKHLEQSTNCKFFIRGKGSMRNKAAEDDKRGKPGFEHLDEELHVIITASDEMTLNNGIFCIEEHLVPVDEKFDALKHNQLRHLALIRGNYSVAKDLQHGMQVRPLV